jgi:hypothetical protein
MLAIVDDYADIGRRLAALEVRHLSLLDGEAEAALERINRVPQWAVIRSVSIRDIDAAAVIDQYDSFKVWREDAERRSFEVGAAMDRLMRLPARATTVPADD